MSRPLLLDLFCGAGGAAMGYHRAGFDVVGVGIEPQPHYPFEFHQADALEWVRNSDDADWCRISAIHASPPCQFYSAMSACRPGLAAKYPALIEPIRELLDRTDLPYVIENVPGARRWMNDPITLCGQAFGLELYRHRLFESSMPLQALRHDQHVIPASKAGHWRPGTIMSVSGHIAPIAHARRVMGIDWTNRRELAEAIPPAYAEFIGAQPLTAIEVAA